VLIAVLRPRSRQGRRRIPSTISVDESRGGKRRRLRNEPHADGNLPQPFLTPAHHWRTRARLCVAELKSKPHVRVGALHPAGIRGLFNHGPCVKPAQTRSGFLTPGERGVGRTFALDCYAGRGEGPFGGNQAAEQAQFVMPWVGLPPLNASTALCPQNNTAKRTRSPKAGTGSWKNPAGGGGECETAFFKARAKRHKTGAAEQDMDGNVSDAEWLFPAN